MCKSRQIPFLNAWHAMLTRQLCGLELHLGKRAAAFRTTTSGMAVVSSVLVKE